MKNIENVYFCDLLCEVNDLFVKLVDLSSNTLAILMHVTCS